MHGVDSAEHESHEFSCALRTDVTSRRIGVHPIIVRAAHDDETPPRDDDHIVAAVALDSKRTRTEIDISEESLAVTV